MAGPKPAGRYLPAMGHTWLTPLYDPLTRLLGVRSLHRELVRQADIHPRQRVLEIGCGTGNLALRAKRSHPDADVVGVDPDAAALGVARRKSARARLDIHWDAGLAQELTYPDGSFDRVLAAMMLHHLEADLKHAALREAHRVLTDHGSLHVVDFGGRSVPADGVMARRLAHTSRLRDNYSEGILGAVREAGFRGVAEVTHRVSRVMGRITFYRADA